MQHKSSSGSRSLTGMCASATTCTCLERASEILELRMASVIGLPVLITISKVVKSSSSSSRYRLSASKSPFAAYAFIVWIWLR